MRVGLQVGVFPDLPTARRTLGALLSSKRFNLLPDDVGVAKLPKYVKGPKQITDGHLLALAERHGARLATLDRGIPDAELIA